MMTDSIEYCYITAPPSGRQTADVEVLEACLLLPVGGAVM